MILPAASARRWSKLIHRKNHFNRRNNRKYEVEEHSRGWWGYLPPDIGREENDVSCRHWSHPPYRVMKVWTKLNLNTFIYWLLMISLKSLRNHHWRLIGLDSKWINWTGTSIQLSSRYPDCRHHINVNQHVNVNQHSLMLTNMIILYPPGITEHMMTRVKQPAT